MLAFIKATSGPMASILKSENRSDIDREAYTQTCLRVMAQAHFALAQNVPTKGLSKELKKELDNYRDALAEHPTLREQLNDHLIELTRDWRCPTCGEYVADKLIRTADQADIMVVCKSCGETSALSTSSLKRAHELFSSRSKTTVSPARQTSGGPS